MYTYIHIYIYILGSGFRDCGEFMCCLGLGGEGSGLWIQKRRFYFGGLCRLSASEILFEMGFVRTCAPLSAWVSAAS